MDIDQGHVCLRLFFGDAPSLSLSHPPPQNLSVFCVARVHVNEVGMTVQI